MVAQNEAAESANLDAAPCCKSLGQVVEDLFNGGFIAGGVEVRTPLLEGADKVGAAHWLS
jgi:hypothetical protein